MGRRTHYSELETEAGRKRFTILSNKAILIGDGCQL